MIKIKQTKNGLFKLYGLNCTHLEALSTLVSNTRLGEGIYEGAIFDIVEAFETLGSSVKGYDFSPDECSLNVTFEDEHPTINLVSNYD